MSKRPLFLFRRDLRLTDNTGLEAACQSDAAVIPAFIFDPRQCDPGANRFFSKHAFAFLVHSLMELDTALREHGRRLYVFEGAPGDIITRLIDQGDVGSVYVNRDYTPFARRRDDRLRTICHERGATFHAACDLLLSEPEDVRPDAGGAYHVFSRFRRHAQSLGVPRPGGPAPGPFFSGSVSVPEQDLAAYDRYPTASLRVKGGRAEGEALLSRVGNLPNYRRARHRPDKASLTALSAHHKFGTVSIRETYWTVQDAYDGYHKLISQLYWRDFYTHLLYHHPHLLNSPLRPLGNHLDWRNNRDEFDRWCHGETGIPFVDAGMRELNETGYMHNRARMTVASFLTKDLLVDWRWGAQYFARTLTDYDPAVNAGNWQWSASVGTDYKLRIYNPYLQAKKHDPEARYIKRWVPELREVDETLLTNGAPIDVSDDAAYPSPVVDRNTAYHRAKDAFANASEAAKRTGQ